MNGIQESQKSESVQNVNPLTGIDPKRKGSFCLCGNKAQTGRCKPCYSKLLKDKRRGCGNPNWKGDSIGVDGIHAWITRRKPKTFCVCCGNPAHDLANISGKYTRDINDYQWLCRKCHMKSDGRLKNLDWTGKKQSKEMVEHRCSRTIGRKNSQEIIMKFKEVAKLRPRNTDGKFVCWGP